VWHRGNLCDFRNNLRGKRADRKYQHQRHTYKQQRKFQKPSVPSGSLGLQFLLVPSITGKVSTHLHTSWLLVSYQSQLLISMGKGKDSDNLLFWGQL
jgi:hypothetical protein